MKEIAIAHEAGYRAGLEFAHKKFFAIGWDACGNGLESLKTYLGNEDDLATKLAEAQATIKELSKALDEAQPQSLLDALSTAAARIVELEANTPMFRLVRNPTREQCMELAFKVEGSQSLGVFGKGVGRIMPEVNPIHTAFDWIMELPSFPGKLPAMEEPAISEYKPFYGSHPKGMFQLANHELVQDGDVFMGAWMSTEPVPDRIVGTPAGEFGRAVFRKPDGITPDTRPCGEYDTAKYRRLNFGEVIPAERLVWANGKGPWEKPNLAIDNGKRHQFERSPGVLYTEMIVPISHPITPYKNG
jgi:hypothetical protein